MGSGCLPREQDVELPVISDPADNLSAEQDSPHLHAEPVYSDEVYRVAQVVELDGSLQEDYRLFKGNTLYDGPLYTAYRFLDGEVLLFHGSEQVEADEVVTST